jgi:hypothetical protein
MVAAGSQSHNAGHRQNRQNQHDANNGFPHFIFSVFPFVSFASAR